MRLRVWWHLMTSDAARALLRNKGRSGLAMLCIMIAVASVIWVVAIGQAGIQRAEDDLASLGANLVWLEAGSRNAAGVRTGSRGANTLTVKDAAAIRNEVSQIAAVSENADGNLQAMYADRNWGTHYRGVSPEYQDIKRWQLARGRFFTADELDHAERVVVIGDTVRRQLFGDIDPIGEIIRAHGALFAVVGVLAAKGQSATGQDQDDTVMMPWTTSMQILRGKDERWLDDILCSAVSAEAVPAATEALSALIRARHHIRAGQDDDFNIRHPEEVLQAKIETSKTYSVLMLTLGLLVLMVSGIGIMNVMLASVSQRTREIGVRIAVGATPGQVQAQFLGEALMLALVGGTLGVGLSLVGAVVIEHRLGWPLVMSVETTALALLFSAVVGVLFGFYPSIRASRLDPIEALRNE